MLLLAQPPRVLNYRFEPPRPADLFLEVGVGDCRKTPFAYYIDGDLGALLGKTSTG